MIQGSLLSAREREKERERERVCVLARLPLNEVGPYWVQLGLSLVLVRYGL